ncbi:MAG TPA: AI-2E family transporter [Acetivibrio sp.]|nr:AI-2E family transporter [Clostridium sp.]HQA57539.1 AI-2E family transporter [Acetivibrio sp.]
MFYKDRKIPYIKFLPIIAISLILYKVINNTDALFDGIKYVFSLLSYLIWGFVIAYFLNPVMVFIEKKLKVRRFISICIIYFLIAVILFVCITVITPRLVENVKQLVDNMPSYIENTEVLVEKTINELKRFDKYNMEEFVEQKANKLLDKTSELFDTSINFVFKKTMDITSTLFKFFFGLLIAIYFLNDKEKLIKYIKKLLYAVFDKKTAYMLISTGSRVNFVFSRFILGKTIDSLIIGGICFLFLSIFRMPFPLLISLIVGITNMIPYVGPFIGAIPSIVITLFVSPIKAVWLAVFILILQQFDGWYLGPKIIGDQVGISPLLIITAITIGGGVYRIVGIFVAVPLFALIKMFLDEYVEKRLKAQNIEIDEIK